MVSRVRAEREFCCPFSIAHEYAADFLRELEGAPLVAGSLSRPITLRFAFHDDVSDLVRRHDAIVLAWRTGSSWLPDCAGALRFRIAPHDCTVAHFEGTYTPPFGLIGAAFDLVVGHRIASSTADDLLRRMASYVERREQRFRVEHVALS